MSEADKKPANKPSGFSVKFKKFLRVVFVESWGLKIISLAFAAVIWLFTIAG